MQVIEYVVLGKEVIYLRSYAGYRVCCPRKGSYLPEKLCRLYSMLSSERKLFT